MHQEEKEQGIVFCYTRPFCFSRHKKAVEEIKFSSFSGTLKTSLVLVLFPLLLRYSALGTGDHRLL